VGNPERAEQRDEFSGTRTAERQLALDELERLVRVARVDSLDHEIARDVGPAEAEIAGSGQDVVESTRSGCS